MSQKTSLPAVSPQKIKSRMLALSMARRFVQLAVLALFIGTVRLGWTLLGEPLLNGTLTSSLIAGTVPMSDPFALLQKLFAGQQASSVYHFNNTENIFSAVDGRYSFILLTMSSAEQVDCVFYATNERHLKDERRHVHFLPDDIPLINPNTQTIPLVRSETDLELCRKLYQHVPVLLQELPDGSQINPWQIQTMSMFHMSNDSNLFLTKGTPAYEQALQQGKTLVPLYESISRGTATVEDALATAEATMNSILGN